MPEKKEPKFSFRNLPFPPRGATLGAQKPKFTEAEKGRFLRDWTRKPSAEQMEALEARLEGDRTARKKLLFNKLKTEKLNVGLIPRREKRTGGQRVLDSILEGERRAREERFAVMVEKAKRGAAGKTEKK